MPFFLIFASLQRPAPQQPFGAGRSLKAPVPFPLFLPQAQLLPRPAAAPAQALPDGLSVQATLYASRIDPVSVGA